ncbi:MAG: PaaI family thioesterase [Kiritimatiellae bacterium]|nr:PaaI family thioesterase [Kiritimatiellia bacterium]
MITKPSQALLEATREAYHGQCVVCAGNAASGPVRLGVRFRVESDGSVSGSFDPPAHCQGYNGFLHGGLIASLLDGAMTNCLFAHGLVALTGELSVRYLHPVASDRRVEVTARTTKSFAALHCVEGRLHQGNTLMARATAKFVEAPAAVRASGDAAADGMAQASKCRQ